MLPPPNLRPEELLARLAELTESTGAITDRDSLLERAAEKLQDLLGAEGVAIFPVQGGRRIDSPGARVLHLPPRLDSRQQAEFAQATMPVLFTAHKYRVRDLPAEITENLDSLWVPLLGKSQHESTLAIFRRPVYPFTELDREAARSAANQISLQLKAMEDRGEVTTENRMPNEQFAAWHAIGANLINPLTALAGYLELLRQENLSEKSRQFVEKMHVQVEKLQRTATRISGQWQPAPMPEPKPEPQPRTPVMVQAEPPPAPTPGPIAARVLLMQPNASVAQYEISVLRAMGMEVLLETTLQAGLEALFANRADALILDETFLLEHIQELQQLVTANPDLQQKRVLVTVSAGTNVQLPQYFQPIPKPLSFQAIRSGLLTVLGSRTQEKSRLN